MKLASHKEIASDLMQDDHFKMGGKYYRVASTAPNAVGGVVIHFYDITKRNPDMQMLIVSPNLKLKIYNQI